MSTGANLAPPLWGSTRQEPREQSKGSRDRLSVSASSSGIVELAHNLALPCEDATGDGGALLRNLRFHTFRVFGPVLLRSPLAPPAFQNTATDSQQEPHSEAILWIREATRLSISRVADLLGVTRPTIYTWQANGDISDANRRRLFAVREILERAKRIHNTPTVLAAWLDSPRGTDGRTPFDLLASGDLDRARLYALSTPSRQVQASSEGSARPSIPRFRTRPEYVAEAHSFDDDEELSKLLGEDPDD